MNPEAASERYISSILAAQKIYNDAEGLGIILDKPYEPDEIFEEDFCYEQHMNEPAYWTSLFKQEDHAYNWY